LFNQNDHPGTGGNGAIGLAITDLDFGLALFKPVALADTSSYYALQATANGISLVGVPGVGITATNLRVEVNGASVPATGGAAPVGPPPPVINFKAPKSTFGAGGYTVGIGGGGTVILDMNTRTIAASGDVAITLDFNTDGTPEITLQSRISFEQSFRPNGSSV